MDRRTALLCGWAIIVSAAAVGCVGTTSDESGGSVDQIEASGLTQQVSFAHVEMHLPENWGVYACRPAVPSTRRPSR